MKYIAIAALILLTGCSAGLKLPGTKDPATEQIKLLTHAIEKQSEAIVAISGAKLAASPTPTPPSPEEKLIKPDGKVDDQDPLYSKIASARIK